MTATATPSALSLATDAWTAAIRVAERAQRERQAAGRYNWVKSGYEYPADLREAERLAIAAVDAAREIADDELLKRPDVAYPEDIAAILAKRAARA